MEYDQSEQNQENGFFNRLKESPRTVSVLIVILIVAAAIYAFSGKQQNQAGPQEQQASPVESTATPETVSPEVLSQKNQALPAGERTDAGYVETAQAGDGITHLARRAAIRYLNENQPSYTLTNEHRIYIEDYIKDHIGSRGLALGEKVTISTSLVQEAVQSAGTLTAQQLHSLSKYTPALQ